MKSLIEYIKEYFANPMNTIGMGNVSMPSIDNTIVGSDPICNTITNLKKKKKLISNHTFINKDKTVNEKLVISKKLKQYQYTYQPKDKEELRAIIEQRLSEDKNADLNDIDVCQINDMSVLFYQLDPHNIKIDRWDVSNVEDMTSMFEKCENFDCDLSNWDVSNVTNMKYMFYNCYAFNSNLESWNVSNAKNMFAMFYQCKKFNNDLAKWDVNNVTNMAFMFYNCKSLKNKPIWYKG